MLRSSVFLGLCATSPHAFCQWFQWTVGQGGNDHFYRVILSSEAVSWSTASNEAQTLGGYLATLTSAAENTFAYNLSSASEYWNGARGPWLGAYQEAGATNPETGWHWVTGETWSFTNWYPGEPNDVGPMEDKLHFFNLAGNPGDTWNDLTDTADEAVYSFIVERDSSPASVPEPISMALMAGAVVLGYRRICGRRVWPR